MTNTNTQATSAIGLDVGTSRIVTARRKDKDLQFAKQLNAFVTIPFSKLTQGVLKKEASHICCRIPKLSSTAMSRSGLPISFTRRRGGPCCAAS